MVKVVAINVDSGTHTKPEKKAGASKETSEAPHHTNESVWVINVHIVKSPLIVNKTCEHKICEHLTVTLVPAMPCNASAADYTASMEKSRFETPEISAKGRAGNGQAGEPVDRPCEHDGCGGHGIYPAPRSRSALRDYIWLCLDCVRDYNRQWNYFDGCDEQEMEAAIRSSTTWERPSWKFGSTGRGGHGWGDAFRDPFDILGGGGKGGDQARGAPEVPVEEQKAWGVFGLSPCACAETVKKRYKELAKRHHPDANGGSKKSEDRLKTINWAYGVLKAQF